MIENSKNNLQAYNLLLLWFKLKISLSHEK